MTLEIEISSEELLDLIQRGFQDFMGISYNALGDYSLTGVNRIGQDTWKLLVDVERVPV